MSKNVSILYLHSADSVAGQRVLGAMTFPGILKELPHYFLVFPDSNKKSSISLTLVILKYLS